MGDPQSPLSGKGPPAHQTISSQRKEMRKMNGDTGVIIVILCFYAILAIVADLDNRKLSLRTAIRRFINRLKKKEPEEKDDSYDEEWYGEDLNW
jgi:hypothetical protein